MFVSFFANWTLWVSERRKIGKAKETLKARIFVLIRYAKSSQPHRSPVKVTPKQGATTARFFSFHASKLFN